MGESKAAAAVAAVAASPTPLPANDGDDEGENKGVEGGDDAPPFPTSADLLRVLFTTDAREQYLSTSPPPPCPVRAFVDRFLKLRAALAEFQFAARMDGRVTRTRKGASRGRLLQNRLHHVLHAASSLPVPAHGDTCAHAVALLRKAIEAYTNMANLAEDLHAHIAELNGMQGTQLVDASDAKFLRGSREVLPVTVATPAPTRA